MCDLSALTAASIACSTKTEHIAYVPATFEAPILYLLCCVDSRELNTKLSTNTLTAYIPVEKVTIVGGDYLRIGGQV